MGRRGPPPKGAEERAARNTRDRRAPSTFAPAWIRAKEREAERLGEIGMEAIEQAARDPLVKSRANGQQLSPRAAFGFKCLERRDKIYAFLERLRHTPHSGARGPAPRGTALSAFRRRREGKPRA